MSDAIISVENLGKKYRLQHQGERQRYTALRDVIAQKAKGFFRKVGERSAKNGEATRSPLSTFQSSRAAHEDFWALKDVSFEIKRGEVVGIIGRNGAGKSTLLKILSRITEPTTGEIKLRGRVASLLEVGTGFHPELTGRENIFLNGAILGMSRAEIRKKFDEIVQFAEVEKFLDTPVKRYSSGMYVRLAFAVAAHLEPEILIVDEVLAVGDAQFQKKCLGKMESVATQEGRTVLFVSHNMGAVSQLCRRAVLLNEGRLDVDGTPEHIIKLYSKSTTNETKLDLSKHFRGPLAGKLQCKRLRTIAADGSETAMLSPASRISIEAEWEAEIDIPAFRITMAVFAQGVRLFSMHDVFDAKPIKSGCQFKTVFELPSHFLRPGDYFMALGGHSATNGDWLWAVDISQFTVLEEWGENFKPYDTGLINVPRCAKRIISV